MRLWLFALVALVAGLGEPAWAQRRPVLSSPARALPAHADQAAARPRRPRSADEAVHRAPAARGKNRARGGAGTVVIDIGGEGRHRGAINLNPSWFTSTTGRPGRPIPNHVVGEGERLPFRAGVADTLIVEHAPLHPGSVAELARVLKPGGTIRLVHPQEYAVRLHPDVIAAIGGHAVQTTRAGITTTIVIAPRRRQAPGPAPPR